VRERGLERLLKQKIHYLGTIEKKKEASPNSTDENSQVSGRGLQIKGEKTPGLIITQSSIERMSKSTT